LLTPCQDTLSDETTATGYDGPVAVLSKGAEAAERRRDAEAAFMAATESLLGRGSSYADLSVEQISAEAGRSRTAFYVYFRDKRELLMRATETVVAELYDEADQWWSGADGRRGLREALTAVLGTYREHGDLLRAVVEAATYDEEVAGFWRSVVARFIKATERRLIQEGEDPSRAAAKAFVLAWMNERVCYQHASSGERPDDPALLAALVDVWETSVYGPG
jgi:TetR/AcrR family transcriptional regulator, ethionamide resistance regulator